MFVCSEGFKGGLRGNSGISRVIEGVGLFKGFQGGIKGEYNGN